MYKDTLSVVNAIFIAIFKKQTNEMIFFHNFARNCNEYEKVF